MAFPGTYNINYYKGDTYEFNIYPKDSSGNQFDLTNFTGGVTFTIATKRGTLPEGETAIVAYSQVDGDHISCAIRPGDGLELISGTQYVYDVQISYSQQPYDLVYTVLSGTVTVTDQVTQ
jgi:hypothetical protein